MAASRARTPTTSLTISVRSSGTFRSFRFSDVNVEVRFEGPVALATETYTYRIERQEGEPIERRGVTTSVLRREGTEWRIVSMHGSSRAPRRTAQ